MERKLKNGGCSRRKALFGADGAITAGATLAAAALQVKATQESAKQQADAMVENAKRQSEAMKLQNQNNTQLQDKQLAFTKEQNAQARQQQTDIQMALQAMAGQQNMNDINERNKAVVKYGGRPKRKLRYNGNITSLRGSNMPFVVTDGGSVIPLTTTEQGNQLYEVVGNDHDHYHNANGKYKSGVGFKFANGGVVEGEGNQNSNIGELLLNTPDGGYFISKHSIKGFNPAKYVLNGMEPEVAFNIQENLKNYYGIRDDGKPAKKSRRHLRTAGGPITNVDTNNQLMYDYFNMADDSALAALPTSRMSLKYGGRPKAANGTYTIGKGNTLWGIARQLTGNGNNWRQLLSLNNGINPNALKIGSTINIPSNWNTNSTSTTPNINFPSIDMTYDGGPVSRTPDSNSVVPLSPSFDSPAATTDPNLSSNFGTTPPLQSQSTGTSRFKNFMNNYGGAILGGLSNIGATLISIGGNNSASRILSDAQTRASGIMSNAYDQLKGIDLSKIRLSDYDQGSALAAIRLSDSNINPMLERYRRNAISERRLVNRGTLSSAARQQRLAGINDRLGQRYSEAYMQKLAADEKVKLANNEAINNATIHNAQLKNQARQSYMRDFVDMMKYNNEIDNSKILGKAGVQSEAATNIAQANANASLANANALGSGLTGLLGGFANTYSALQKQRADERNILLGAGNDAAVRYVALNGDNNLKNKYRTLFSNILKNGRGLSNELKQRYNNYLYMLNS